MSSKISFTKENLDRCLRELGKEFRRLNGTAMPAEITLIGGASVLANYGFRDMTYDVDAMIRASSAMKEAINRVGDRLGLPAGWLNSDFTWTKSYTPKLAEYSVYYKTFSNVLTVRTISGEYLIAMKLMSSRQYKNDISDIVGILREQKERGSPFTLQQIETAVCNLYGGWDHFPKTAFPLIKEIMESGRLEELYRLYREEEKNSKETLIEFEKDYPGVAKEDNIGEILKNLKARKQRDLEK